MMEEMATVARDYELNWSIVVCLTISPCFMLYDSTNMESATKRSCISFLKPEYVGVGGWVLNEEEKKKLIGFLDSSRRGRKSTKCSMSNWRRAIVLWNKEVGYIDDESEVEDLTEIDTPLPYTTPRPNYFALF